MPALANASLGSTLIAVRARSGFSNANARWILNRSVLRQMKTVGWSYNVNASSALVSSIVIPNSDGWFWNVSISSNPREPSKSVS